MKNYIDRFNEFLITVSEIKDVGVYTKMTLIKMYMESLDRTP